MPAYFDNAATTQPCQQAIDAVNRAMTQCWGNPSSLYRPGDAAHTMVETARGQVAAALGCDKDRVFFTSGGTEADNWAIFAAAEKVGKRGRHMITSAIEHHAVLNCCARLEQQGWDVTYLQPDKDGNITVEQFRAALRPDTVLVSIMMVNNEVGSCIPVDVMGRYARKNNRDCIVHADGVQCFLKRPFKAKTTELDLISVSGHKVHGPKGVGALYIKPGLNLPPYVCGGGQESGLRSGTENVPGIAGFGAACAALAPTLLKDYEAMDWMRRELVAELKKLDGLLVLASGDAPHIICASIPGMRSQGILNKLQDRGVYVSAGSACSRGRRSHVLEAMGVDPMFIDGAFRISLSRDTTKADVTQLINSLKQIL